MGEVGHFLTERGFTKGRGIDHIWRISYFQVIVTQKCKKQNFLDILTRIDRQKGVLANVMIKKPNQCLLWAEFCVTVIIKCK